MSRQVLEQIEQQLADLDPEALSFDHEDAENCRLALARIVNKAAALCQAISADPPREEQKATGWRYDADAMIRQAPASLPRRQIVVEAPEIVTVGGGSITITKSDE